MIVIIYIACLCILLIAIWSYMKNAGVFSHNYDSESPMSIGDVPKEEDESNATK